MILHSNNRQLIVRGTDGIGFQAALSHVEAQGQHVVVVTVSDEHRARLEKHTELFAQLLCQEYGLKLPQLLYFERRDNGVVQRDLSSRTPEPSASSRSGAGKPPATLFREERVQQYLGGAQLPTVVPSLPLSQIVTRMEQEVKAVLQQAKRFALGRSRRQQRHRLPRLG